MGKKGHIMDQKGLKMHEKKQKIEFSNLKYLLFSGIFLSGNKHLLYFSPRCGACLVRDLLTQSCRSLPMLSGIKVRVSNNTWVVGNVTFSIVQ